MKYFGIVFISSILFHITSALFSCPPQEAIYPCQCRVEPQKIVRCDGVSNLRSVRKVLEPHFSQNLPKLKLTNVHSLSLPPHALGTIKPRKLVLSESNIRNIDDDAFEGQDMLGYLIMSEDRLESIPTQALRRLTALQTLSFVGNFLMRIQQGSMDNLTHLKYLVLSDNRISEIDKATFPKNIESITLSRNLLRNLNGSFNHLEHLKEIILRDNRLTSIRGEFIGLSKLNSLSLERNYISEIPDSFANLFSLQHLSLSNNRIVDIGKALMSLAKLKHLDLSHNYLTDLHWRVFEKLKELEFLDLSGNFIRSVCPILKPLRQMQELKLSDLSLKSLDLDCFHNMKFLERLDLSHNSLSTIDAVTRHPLPGLIQLRLSYNRLTSLNHELKYMKSLKELDIRFNNISSFKTLDPAYNRELVLIRITGNPWKCTNSMMEVLENMDLEGIEIEGRPSC